MNKSKTTTRLSVLTRAKLNLALEVLHKRKDGFHEIETIFQSIDLHDTLELELNNTGEIAITCTDPDIPTGADNLCHRALVRMREYAGEDLGMVLHIDKNIPPRSGLGGGSANCAGILIAIDRSARLDLPIATLESVAAGLGSDVPFMLHGGTMLGRGRGERLTRLDPLQAGFFLIVKPPVDISTADVYKGVNFRLTKHRYRINLKAVNTLFARFPSVPFSFRNALEDVVCPSYPLVAEVLDEMIHSGTRFAAMSGSGSAIFSICESEAKASQLAERFSARGFFTTVAKPSQRAVEIMTVEAR